MEKSSGRGTELELAASALKQTPRSATLVGGLDRPALAVIAYHAANALRPARPDQMIQCSSFGGELARQRIEIHCQPLSQSSSSGNRTCVKGIIIPVDQH